MTQPADSNQKRSVDSDVPIRRLIYYSTVILLVQVICGYGIYAAFGEWEDRAAFGSMFGAVGTLFSGIAFGGVIYTILLQREDLKLQRNELAMTRDELKRSAAAQEKSEQALVEQARMMELTARLTAMNFLAETYRNKIDFLSKQGREYQLERNEWNEIMQDLEQLTRQIGKKDDLSTTHGKSSDAGR